MKTSGQVIVCLMTAGVSLLSVMGNKAGPVNDCYNPPVDQTAYLGGSVTINCKYPEADERVRYFCREDGNFQCNNLVSTYTSNITKRDRFSLTDDRQQQVYTVSISTLTHQDAGKYWCAMKSVDDNPTACLNEIHLRILNWEDITAEQVADATSKTTKITCSYSDSHQGNEKFLCKGETPLNCKELIHTTEENRDVGRDVGRFHIRDNERLKYFYVYIKNLSSADSGTYWCGFGRTMQRADYNKIHLSVAEKPSTKNIKTKMTDLGNTREDEDEDEEKHKDKDKDKDKDKGKDKDKDKGMIAGIAVCLPFVAVFVIVLILYRRILFRTQACCVAGESSDAGQNTEGNNGAHDYEEINLQNQLPSSLPSVYATVNVPADPLHYSSVRFQTDGNTLPDTNTNGSSASISKAQGATHPQPAEQTVYSTVTKPGKQ